MAGKDWLSEAKLILIADYGMDGCVLLESHSATRAVLPHLHVIGAGACTYWTTAHCLWSQL